MTSLAEPTKPGLSAAPAQSDQFTNGWPQFLGPHRNCQVEQPRLGRDWKARPPQRLWVRSVGPGWSGFAVAGRRAITQEQRGEYETVICYDLLSGAPLWSYAYPAHFRSSLAGESPRATPTVAGQRVHALGSTGILSCLDVETGTLLWSKDILRDNEAKNNEWGMSSSPLIWKSNRLKAKCTNLTYRDGFIYGLDDGNMVCLDASNGERRWKEGRYGHGQEILAGDLLLVTGESGEVILLDPNPQTSRELTRFSALKGKTWNPPALAGECLLVRNEKEAACYRLTLAQPLAPRFLRGMELFEQGGGFAIDGGRDIRSGGVYFAVLR